MLPELEALRIWREGPGAYVVQTPKGDNITANASEVDQKLKLMGFDGRESRGGGGSLVSDRCFPAACNDN